MQECKRLDDDDNMILCDWCDKGVHTYCHQPKLSGIPDDDQDWYCFRCTRDRADEIRAFKDARDLALGLREQHRAAQRRAGISDEEMLEAMEALLAGEGPTQSAASGDGATGGGAAGAFGEGAESKAQTANAAAAPCDAAGAAAERVADDAAQQPVRCCHSSQRRPRCSATAGGKRLRACSHLRAGSLGALPHASCAVHVQAAMDTGEDGPERQAAMDTGEDGPERQASSVQLAAAGAADKASRELDRIAAAHGGAMSAAAVLALAAKGKKKKKKQQQNGVGATQQPAASASQQPAASASQHVVSAAGARLTDRLVLFKVGTLSFLLSWCSGGCGDSGDVRNRRGRVRRLVWRGVGSAAVRVDRWCGGARGQ
jgi:PHD-finger